MPCNDQRARQRGNNGKTRRHQRRHVHCRLGDTDHRLVGQLTRGQQTRIAKASNDMTAHTGFSAGFHLLQNANGSNGFVKMSLYRWRPFLRADRQDFGARRSHRTRRRGDGFGHCLAGVRIDDLNNAASCHSVSRGSASAKIWAKSGVSFASWLNRKLATISSKWRTI
ncbi:hypothetical protein D3C80_1110790 [compost metagenome]